MCRLGEFVSEGTLVPQWERQPVAVQAAQPREVPQVAPVRAAAVPVQAASAQISAPDAPTRQPRVVRRHLEVRRRHGAKRSGMPPVAYDRWLAQAGKESAEVAHRTSRK